MEELIPITLFLCVTAVLILRPISKKVGALLDALTRERLQQQSQTGNEAQLARATLLLEQVSRRLEIMEERLDFTERLVGSGRRHAGPQLSESVGVLDDVGLGREALHGSRR